MIHKHTDETIFIVFKFSCLSLEISKPRTAFFVSKIDQLMAVIANMDTVKNVSFTGDQSRSPPPTDTEIRKIELPLPTFFFTKSKRTEWTKSNDAA